MKVLVPVATFVLLVAGLLVADMLANTRYTDGGAGFNISGYRGKIVGGKRPGEQRVVVLGGSTAFGYAVHTDETFPYQLEEKLNAQRQRSGGGPVSVVNLGYNNEGAYSYKYTIRDYAYLDPDVVLLYAGYNDLGGPNTQVYRHQSPVFRMTGYMPTLPLWLREKAMLVRYRGNLDTAYRNEKVTFTPTAMESATANTLDAAEKITLSLGRQVDRFAKEYQFETRGETLCADPWAFFCRQMHDATELALSEGKRVLVVSDPIMNYELARQKQGDQQAALKAMLEKSFPGKPVEYVTMANVVDMANRELQLDGMHLSKKGNELVAERLVEPVLALLNK